MNPFENLQLHIYTFKPPHYQQKVCDIHDILHGTSVPIGSKNNNDLFCEIFERKAIEVFYEDFEIPHTRVFLKEIPVFLLGKKGATCFRHFFIAETEDENFEYIQVIMFKMKIEDLLGDHYKLIKDITYIKTVDVEEEEEDSLKESRLMLMKYNPHLFKD